MKAVGRILFVVIAVGLVIESPVTAQIKNPIQAAKDAFKKAREEEGAKRSQRPPRPQQPTQAPVSPPSAPGGATAECCSPEALSKLAASVGFVDIVGVKLGMTLEQAVAALKVANPKFVIDIHDGEIEAGGKRSRRPRVILAPLPPSGRNPLAWHNLDGSHEAIGVQLTTPPGPLVVEMVSRYVSFPSAAPVAAATLIDALRKKYGSESYDHNLAALSWVFDSTGKLLPNPSREQVACTGPQNAQMISLEIRSGDGLSEPGRVIPGLGIVTFDQSPVFNQYTAKCVSYVVATAQILHRSPTELVGDFWTSIQSIGLQHNSLALTVDFVRRENENAIKPQEDAGAKRAAPKL